MPFQLDFDEPQNLALEMWLTPWRMAECWSSLWISAIGLNQREIDCMDKTAQLPVPNPHQQAKDEKLFA